MKSLSKLAVVLLLASPLGAAVGDNKFYIGGGMFPLEITGVKDIAVSDWQTYGLGPAEGRIRLPLSKAATSGILPGFTVGVEREFVPRIKGLLEAQGAFATGSYATSLNVGLNWTAFQQERFSLGLVPKVGYAIGTVDFGTAKVIPGKTAPVITADGTIKDGDKIEANVSGVSLGGAVNAVYMFTDMIGLSLDAGYIYAVLSDFNIKAGAVTLKKGSPALVKDDGSATQAGIDPKATIAGPVAMLSLIWKFN